MSDTTPNEIPEPSIDDDVEGHAVRAGRLGDAETDDVEGHVYRPDKAGDSGPDEASPG